MVSEPLLWPFLSSLVFIGVTPFSISLLPSQQLLQPLTVEPPTSSNRCLWVPDLQPLLLRSLTSYRPLHMSLPPWILHRLCFYRYHWDRFAPIYTLVEALQLSEIARALTHHPNILCPISCVTCAPMRWHWQPSSRASTRLHVPDLHLLTSALGDVIYWHHCPPSTVVTHHIKLLTCINHTVDLCWLDYWLWPRVDFLPELTFAIQVLLTQFFA